MTSHWKGSRGLWLWISNYIWIFAPWWHHSVLPQIHICHPRINLKSILIFISGITPYTLKIKSSLNTDLKIMFFVFQRSVIQKPMSNCIFQFFPTAVFHWPTELFTEIFVLEIDHCLLLSSVSRHCGTDCAQLTILEPSIDGLISNEAHGTCMYMPCCFRASDRNCVPKVNPEAHPQGTASLVESAKNPRLRLTLSHAGYLGQSIDRCITSGLYWSCAPLSNLTAGSAQHVQGVALVRTKQETSSAAIHPKRYHGCFNLFSRYFYFLGLSQIISWWVLQAKKVA